MWRYVLHSLYRCKTNGQINISAHNAAISGDAIQ